MTPEQIRAAGFGPLTALALPIHAKGKHVEMLLANKNIVSRTKWAVNPHDCVGMLGWRYADPADAQRVIAAKDAEIARLREGLADAVDLLIELNPSNYTHDDVCKANSATVETIMAIGALLENTNG